MTTWTGLSKFNVPLGLHILDSQSQLDHNETCIPEIGEKVAPKVLGLFDDAVSL